MDKPQFTELFAHLFTGLGSRPVSGQADVWYQVIYGRGFSYPVVAKAVETLIAESRTSRPLPRDLIAECAKIQVRTADRERAAEKEEENAPWRAQTVNGAPVLKFANKVAAALRGDEEAGRELGWEQSV